MKTKFTFCILAIALFASVVSAQWNDAGKLNVWTLKTVSRAATAENLVYLKDVRVAKNKGFDRVVFEFTGGLPRYEIQYVKSGLFPTEGETTVKVRGKYFVDINLQPLPYPDDPKDADVKIPKGNQHLRVFNEIKQVEWFEGVRAFGVGLNAKKMFRVQELKDPYRLVVDFKQ